MKIISFGRNCLIIVSNFVLQTSSLKALKLNSDVELSRAQIPKVLFVLASISLVASSRREIQWPACSSVRSSSSTRVPFVYTLLSSLPSGRECVFPLVNCTNVPPNDFISAFIFVCFPLGLVRSKTHFCPEGRLCLVNTTNLIACAEISAYIKSKYEKKIDLSQEISLSVNVNWRSHDDSR